MINVAVDWYTNLHTVDNGGHGSSFFEKLQNFKFVKQGMLVLRFVIITLIFSSML